MDPTDDWQRHESALDRLLDMDEQARATALLELERQAPGDARVLRRWLTAIEGSEGYLEDGADQAALGYQDARVGNWRVLGLIGRGGMGEVWLGERADGLFDRRVAIKFIRDDRPELVRSLASECRVLAGLRHPAIVGLLDAGSTEAGHPFLVTDYVEGVALDAWLSDTRPTLSTRLQVFTQIAEAVAHAHEHLVVHRDIKPANLLVDAAGNAHLLDFGIASALANETGSTQVTQLAMTPEFAPPELVADSRASVRTDIYALGALLYFILCEQPPLALRGLSLSALLTRVREEIPEPALRRLAAGLDADPDARWLPDLDAIAGKAMAKAADERYGTVDALLRDVRAAQSDLPVSARQVGFVARARRGLRRHRAAAAVAATMLAILLVGLAGTLWQGHEARVQRDHALAQAQTAEAVRDFLVDVFEAADPELTHGQVPDALALLETAARRVETGLDGQAALQSELFGALGETYVALGRSDLAAGLLHKGLARAASLDARSPQHDRLTLHYARARGPAADVVARLEARLAQPPDPGPQALALRAELRAEYAGQLLRTGRLADAGEALAQAQGDARALGDAGRHALVSALRWQAELASSHGQRGSAIGHLRDVLALLDAHAGPRQMAMRNAVQLDLATHLGQAGLGDEAVGLLRQSVETSAALYGQAHPATISAVINLARALLRQADHVQARELLDAMLALAVEHHGDDSEIAALARINLAALEYAQYRYDRAIALTGQVQAVIVRREGPRGPRALLMQQNLARMRLDAGDLDGAQADLQILRAALRDAGSQALAEPLALTGLLHRKRGEPAVARDFHQRALQALANGGDTGSFDVQDHRLALAEDARDLGEFDVARIHAQAALDGLLALDRDANAGMVDYARFVLAQLDVLAGQCPASAQQALDAFHARQQARTGDGIEPDELDWRIARADLYRGLCRRALDPDDAAGTQLLVRAAAKVSSASQADPHSRRIAAQVAVRDGPARH